MTHAKLSDLIGETLVNVYMDADKNNVYFEASDGRVFSMTHHQDCCESVSVEDICGDLQDLVGSPILEAEEVSNSGHDYDDPVVDPPYDNCESWTWTFYKLATNKGSVTIRWLGTSNGYYSEGVDFVLLEGRPNMPTLREPKWS